MRNDLKGAKHQRVAPQEPPARRQRAAVFRADRAGPNHVEVLRRKRSVVPAPDVAQDGGSNFDTMSRETTSLHRLGAAEKLQEPRHF